MKFLRLAEQAEVYAAVCAVLDESMYVFERIVFAVLEYEDAVRL